MIDATVVPWRVYQRAADHREQRGEERSYSEAKVHYSDVLHVQVNLRICARELKSSLTGSKSNLFRNRLPCKFDCLQRKEINFAL